MLPSDRMGAPHITRRSFATGLAAAAAHLQAQTSGPSLAHTDVAKLDGARILADAKRALEAPLPTQPAVVQPALQRACFTVATLTAAYLVSREDTYATRAGQHLAALFITPGTRLNPEPEIANPTPSAAPPAPGTLSITHLAPLAEVARALAFLGDTPALTPADLDATHAWFAAHLDWLTTAHNFVLARDTKDHNASAWLLLAAGIARSLRNDRVLEDCRHRFRKPTLRNQINLEGVFPHEVASETPFRSTLLNFDLLAGCAQLLSTPFDDPWAYELEDGTSLRSAVAYLYPSLQERHNWRYMADPQIFRDLPGRRPGLLFAGRAYNRPEYVATWQATPSPDIASLPEPIAASFPIREPLLFTDRALHGL